jgi:hypothetical protein
LQARSLVVSLVVLAALYPLFTRTEALPLRKPLLYLRSPESSGKTQSSVGKTTRLMKKKLKVRKRHNQSLLKDKL